MPLKLTVIGDPARDLGTNSVRVFEQSGSIGREAQWQLPDSKGFVSRIHVRIEKENGAYYLTDNNTLNGTLHRGRRLQKGERVVLRSGDEFSIGRYTIAVHIEPEGAAASGGLGALFAGGESDAARSAENDPPMFDAPPGPQLGAMPPIGGRPDPNPPPAPGGVPPNIADLLLGRGKAAAPSSEPPRVPPPPPAFTPPAPPPPAPPRPAPPPPAPPPPQVPRQPAPMAETGRFRVTGDWSSDSAALLGLRAAGIDFAGLDGDALASIGQVLRVVVEGLLEVLRARKDIKREFRAETTEFKPTENNPLKFALNADDALQKLFAHTSGFLPPVDAFQEAFDDLKSHQIAMLAGMRAALTFVLKQFDPEVLEEEFDRGLKRGAILEIMNKTKYWELYRDKYASLADDERSFKRLFGDEFTRAYEDQMRRLTTTRGRG
jgi:type VI secretion system FHA domain protein